ncbi:hypothetical protein [Paludibaculum fermentans]|uniref:hypothetical protein n=1 Tax=Paludibaculum fermentans TaxID=1473598 RepID=UPI003EB8E94F
MFVEEEAAKFLILMDAVRCPPTPPNIFTRHLGNFNQHLAKGLYSRYYGYVLMSLQEANEHLERDRRTHYLDGPSDVDWIFRNDILREREEAVYVDYVATDDGHFWHCPVPERLRIGMWSQPPMVLRMARALRAAGLCRPAALRVIADHWRGLVLDESVEGFRTRELNRRTLELLDENNLLRRRPQSDYDFIVNEWRLPLYPLDMAPINVDPQELRHIQQNWSPADWY